MKLYCYGYDCRLFGSGARNSFPEMSRKSMHLPQMVMSKFGLTLNDMERAKILWLQQIHRIQQILILSIQSTSHQKQIY